MVDTKKENERSDLQNAISNISDMVRGKLDGWDFRSYVLNTMFYRFLSENLRNYVEQKEHNKGNTTFKYATLSDLKAEMSRDEITKEKGFFILPSELFENVVKKVEDKQHVGKTLETIFENIERSSKGTVGETFFKGIFYDFDVASNKLGSSEEKRDAILSTMLSNVAKMKFGDFKDNTIDAFGDAYEHIINMYATNAGKSGGEYYTPQEVSDLLARIATFGKTKVGAVYDPACGSGSLLLKAAKVLGKDNVERGFYGQEINVTTYNLCRINMFLHNIAYNKFEIACDDTLTTPRLSENAPFDIIVSNPPYSIAWEGDDNKALLQDGRYAPAGVLAPKAKADFAFILHSLYYLAQDGIAAVVCFPGIMYRSGAEQKIRKYLVDNNFVDCIIQLPENLFFKTTVPTNILVLKKNRSSQGILFIDGSKECVKVINNNKLSEDNIRKLVEAYASRKEVPYFAHIASYDDVKKENYNLTVNTYVEKEDTREQIDIKKLNAEITEIVARENKLREEIDKIVADLEGL